MIPFRYPKELSIVNMRYHELPGKFRSENKAAVEGALREMSFPVYEFGVEPLTLPAPIETLFDTI